MIREGESSRTTFASVSEVLEFAIGQEKKAEDFYRGLADRATVPGIKAMAAEMAAEEKRHGEMIRNLRDGNPSGIAEGRVTDLLISDYLRDLEIRDDVDQQDLLVLAMKAEARAEKLYRDLAAASDDPEVRALFTTLADEEGSHKDVIEKDYDDNVLDQN